MPHERQAFVHRTALGFQADRRPLRFVAVQVDKTVVRHPDARFGGVGLETAGSFDDQLAFCGADVLMFQVSWFKDLVEFGFAALREHAHERFFVRFFRDDVEFRNGRRYELDGRLAGNSRGVRLHDRNRVARRHLDHENL